MKLWKFLVPLTLCLVLAVLFLPTTANAASSGTCGDNLTWTLDDAGTLTISGTGPMKDYTYSSSAPWYSNRSSVKKVVIEDGVTTVGSYAFSSYSSLTSVMIPDSVTTISSSAFYDHDNRPSIWVRENNSNYSSDSQGVLFNKDKTTLIQAPSTLTGRYMIPDSVTIIESSAFRSCYGLASVTIPDSVTYINNNAFNNCTRLTSVTIGNGVTTIGGDAFYPCSRLTDVWYTGSQSDRNKISIGSYNSYLTSATWHYNSCWGSAMHTYDHACDTDCNVCGKTRTTTHTYNNNCDTDCNVCGYTRTITHKYQWVIDQQENCGVDGIKHEECTVCHVKRNEGTKIPATNAHTYGAWKNNAQDHWKECAVCGGIAQQQSHNYTNSCDTTCNICSYTRTITHQYAWVTTATSHRQKCEVCSKEIDVADHSYDNTCDTVCDVCGYTRAITHTYDNDCDTICNVCNLERTVPAHSYTLNGNHTCDICKYSKTPGKPVVENKTNSSVTLVKTEGFEYSKDGKTWQASNEFTSLAPDTTYTFYQRVKASSTALVSEMSEGMSVTFKSAQAAPSAPVFSSFTDTTLTLIPITGGEYSVDGKTWQTDSVFDDLTPGAKYTVYQRYAETATHEASNSTGTTVTMDKSKQTQIPDAPTVESVTAYSVTLNAVEGCEYSKDGKTWQKSNTFSGLACGVEYTFYQRYAENATHYAGKASQSITAKTDKGNQSKPSAPTLAKKTYNSVTLTVRTGYEYSRDGINWQASNVFTGLAPETNYFFYQRKAETATHYASEASASLIVKTDEEPACVTNPELHVFDNACDTDCNACGNTRTITHDYQWIIDRQETCGTDGMKHEECTVCHAKRSEDTVIPATNAHTYADACDATCNVCKAQRTPPHAPGTEWMHDETAHWRECTLCKQKLEQQAHIDSGEGGCTVCPWKTWIPGDLNGNEDLTTDDAVYLLLHVMFGAEDYPVPDGMTLDFNGDSKLDTNDAVYLLLHVMFGDEDYPLA